MMPMRRLVLALACTVALLAAAPAAPQVPTVTRLVKLFDGLEGELQAALGRADTATLDRLVAADFEQRSGAEPGAPLPRAEWLQLNSQRSDAPSQRLQMAAHERGDTLIVSFLWAHADKRRDLFVVDVWQRQQDQFQLATRYVASASGPRSARPAADTPPKRY